MPGSASCAHLERDSLLSEGQAEAKQLKPASVSLSLRCKASSNKEGPKLLLRASKAASLILYPQTLNPKP